MEGTCIRRLHAIDRHDDAAHDLVHAHLRQRPGAECLHPLFPLAPQESRQARGGASPGASAIAGAGAMRRGGACAGGVHGRGRGARSARQARGRRGRTSVSGSIALGAAPHRSHCSVARSVSLGAAPYSGPALRAARPGRLFASARHGPAGGGPSATRGSALAAPATVTAVAAPVVAVASWYLSAFSFLLFRDSYNLLY